MQNASQWEMSDRRSDHESVTAPQAGGSSLARRVVVVALILAAGPADGARAQEGSEEESPPVERETLRSTAESEDPRNGSLFTPLVAHPLEPMTFVGIAQENSESFSTRLMVMGLGDQVFVSPALSVAGGSLTVGLSAAVFAQFDAAVHTFDFVNADFVVGIPVSFRRETFSARLRLVHQSSHLGDDFIRRRVGEPEQDFDFESLELIASVDLESLRLYGGGEHRVRQTARADKPRIALVGLEWRPDGRLVELGRDRWLRFVLAGQVAGSHATSLAWGRSARAGVELVPSDPGGRARRVALLLDFYRGPTTRGQFSPEHTSVLGLNLQVGVRR